MTLTCSNTECESHENEHPMFNINVAVDGDRTLAENLNKVEPEYFVCVYCQSEAVLDAEREVNDG